MSGISYREFRKLTDVSLSTWRIAEAFLASVALCFAVSVFIGHGPQDWRWATAGTLVSSIGMYLLFSKSWKWGAGILALGLLVFAGSIQGWW